jgi:hypothetical protein
MLSLLKSQLVKTTDTPKCETVCTESPEYKELVKTPKNMKKIYKIKKT